MMVVVVVSIAPKTEVISPLILGNQKNCDELDLDARQSPRKPSIAKKASSVRLSGRRSVASPLLRPGNSLYDSSDIGGESGDSTNDRRSHHHVEQLIDQVSEWIKQERTKRHEKKAQKKPGRRDEPTSGVSTVDLETRRDAEPQKRRGSDASESDLDLGKLEDIIKSNFSLGRRSRAGSIRRQSSLKTLLQRKQSTASSDPDYYEGGDIHVPSCNAVLDNSRTLAYTGGASDDSSASGSEDELQRTTSYRDVDAWAKFKFEIVRLSHTLRLKGWRKVPMEMSNGITVKRLSGALTNAVYVVSPPEDLHDRLDLEESGITVPGPRKPPPKLLLRIYGPQVEHLIDREAELAILRRLARKRIGPRLLGTFGNGRFEEFFYAQTLTPEDLRNPDTSRQIAKRMRELHDGIDLLDEEREAGPFVWRNWDKWVQRVEQVVSWLDEQIVKLEPGAKPSGSEAWKRRGFICGVPWKQFRAMVEKHRSWLVAQYGGSRHISEQLVFAHNDTQYGNILRLIPTGESPLLLPANTHKQLVVIDFEYACANLVGQEFANHFTEWCYNYHDTRKPYAFHQNRYPTPEEQDRFIRAYVRHRPQFNVSTPRMTPKATATDLPPREATTPVPGKSLSRRPTSSISDFMLDARNPSAASNTPHNEETADRKQEDLEVARLVHETRIWRLANSAQWVAWGIVQAKVSGMPEFDGNQDLEREPAGDEEAREELGEDGEEDHDLAELQRKATSDGGPKEEEAEEEFDYLGYAQHRALFFWADAIQVGLVKAEDLPENLREKVKKVPY